MPSTQFQAGNMLAHTANSANCRAEIIVPSLEHLPRAFAYSVCFEQEVVGGSSATQQIFSLREPVNMGAKQLTHAFFLLSFI